MPPVYKIAIVGASTLLGKELNEALGESGFAASDFHLLDDEDALGQIEAVGEEVTFVQRITPESFAGTDFTFFTGTPELTRRHWPSAAAAGSAIIDLSGALAGEPGVVTGAPWLRPADAAAQATLETPAIVPAHPAAVALALLLGRLQKLGALRTAAATVLEPASEFGRAGMDELHQQTVNLLSFQALPKAVFDAQAAFNTMAAFGDNARADLGAAEERIRRDYGLISSGRLPALAVQLVHTPVFHGLSFSLYVEFERAVESPRLEQVLAGEHVDVMLADSDAPSNLSSAGQGDVLVRLRPAGPGADAGYWLWAAADNLRLAALNAVACAQELKRLRPLGKVQ